MRREARARAEAEGRGSFLPPTAATVEVVPPPRRPDPVSTPPLPAPPDTAPVNQAWRAEPASGGGRVRRLVERLLRPRHEAQLDFNARQTQLDNALVEWLQAVFAATHDAQERFRHSATLRMNDIDERHLLLQERLVAHVHDLVRRIDFVLEASERSRLSAEAALKRLSARVDELEKRLVRRR